jgi:tetratricopeptide (TPR) repeat protein
MLLGFGDRYEGQEFLHEAAESSDPGIAAAASWALADALSAEGRSEEAARYLSWAAANADVRLAPDVLLAIGSRCAALGQLDAAVGIYRDFLREATESQRELVALASYRLADICRERGQLQEATTLFLRGFRDGSIALKPHAAIALAELAQEQERDGIAARLFRWVMETDHADLAPQAGYQFAVICREAGDQVSAVRTLRAVALSGHSFYAPIAEEELLQMIDQLDVSDTVEDLIDGVLGDGQLQLGSGVIHFDPQAIRHRCPFPLDNRAAPPTSVGVVFIAIHFAATTQGSRLPLQLEAGESLDDLHAQA